MKNRGASLTNALLVVVILLLVANLAFPLLKSDSGAEPAKGTPAEGKPDDLVVRIPAEQARDLGLEAKDIEGMIGFFHKGGMGRKLLSARLNANETAAIATLRNICSAQAQFQACAMADVNNNGCGEFGSFKELSGADAVRGCSSPINPPVLSGAFRSPNPIGFVSRSGYFYAIFLPDADGKGVPADAGMLDKVHAPTAETTYCVYAWPQRHGHSGHRTFMLNQCGDVLSTEFDGYTGPRLPAPDAAFLAGDGGAITGSLALGEKGRDGNLWRQVN